MYDAEATFSERVHGGRHTVIARREFTVHLLRRRTLVLGRPSFDDGLSRRMIDLDSPVAMQLDDNDDDPLAAICAGQDFGLLTTASGKVANICHGLNYSINYLLVDISKYIIFFVFEGLLYW